ncbi:MAG: hypothetical protein ACLFN0_10450 [Thermovirgaceae bacterium]
MKIPVSHIVSCVIKGILAHYEELTRRFKKIKDVDMAFAINDVFHTIFK